MTVLLPTTTIAHGTSLLHVSRIAYAGSALYFGCAGNRYDDPAGQYGVLYAAFDLPTALMESAFHGHRWYRAPHLMTQHELSQRLVRDLAVFDPLTVLDLNAPGLMAGQLGLNPNQLTSRDYRHTQRIGNQAYAQAGIDGILYPSRNNYPGLCLALFDRCAPKLGLVADIALDRHLHWPHFQRQYGIRVTPA